MNKVCSKRTLPVALAAESQFAAANLQSNQKNFAAVPHPAITGREGIMKPASCSSGRLLSIAVCALLSASATQAADAPEVNATQRPQQVLPTGAEDAAQPAAFARAAVSAAASERESLEQALVESTSESDEGLTTVTLPDGSSMVDLQGRFMHVVVATPTEDGGVAIGCHTGEDAVAHALHANDVATGKAPKDPAPTAVAPQALEEK